MNRRNFFGALAGAAVASSALPAVAEAGRTRLSRVELARPAQQQLNRIMTDRCDAMMLSFVEFEARYLKPYFEAQFNAADRLFAARAVDRSWT